MKKPGSRGAQDLRLGQRITCQQDIDTEPAAELMDDSVTVVTFSLNADITWRCRK